MTFVLKDLSELRKHFDDTVDIILKRETKGKIEDLTKNPQRKVELQFLSSILAKVEEQAKEKNANLVYLQTVFYGAMYTVIQDIENNRSAWESSGLLSNRLKDLIGIDADAKAEDKPDLYQVSKFHTALNKFMNQVFIADDSRNGFAKGHMLAAVPTETLDKLMQTSYKQEQDAQKAIVASFTADGQGVPVLAEYKPVKKSPASATVRFGGWDKLNADLDQLIKDELADKNVHKIEKLSSERIAQFHLLNATRETLKTSALTESEKVATLAGIMHLIRRQIKDVCDASYLKKKENSVVFKGLSKILAADEVTPQDTEALITSATQFAQFMTVGPKTEGKKAIRGNHIFSAIAGFDLKATFNLLIDMIFACRTDSLKIVVEDFKKETKGPEKASKSYLGGIASTLASLGGLYAKKEDEEDEDEDEVLEHKSAPVKT
ncbi:MULTISPECIES: hypothetical protein [Legionella]|uniref:Substrate of the Dot/Icm secretion system n=1 Tax=Legionella steelei TaxID=947033 RepID=A0A0W0ZQ44_9GAMM|nr:MULTISPECIES: hypothetical protein [Legionella]KTD71008.1 substrate of the Dot/Icm secretion system [Legionella steelei]MBN9225957.1 hypothetical protein [Legionella steelei]OJW07926.1 MAG: hypothetical protein BGO44_14935 [Legionella sp. 39-23]